MSPSPLALRASLLRDAFAASDPDLARRRMGLRATLAAALAAAASTAIARTAGERAAIALVGAIFGMQAAIVVQDDTPRAQAVTTLLLVVPAAAAIALGTAVVGHPLLRDATFLAVVFASVYARGFGPRATALGMLGFFGFFDAQFLGARRAELPWLVGMAAVGVESALVVRLLVVPERAAPAARHAVRCFFRAIGVLFGRLALLVARSADERGRAGALHAVRRAARGVNETALAAEAAVERGGAAVAAALDPAFASPYDVRAWLLAVELAASGVTAATMALADAGTNDDDDDHDDDDDARSARTDLADRLLLDARDRIRRGPPTRADVVDAAPRAAFRAADATADLRAALADLARAAARRVPPPELPAPPEPDPPRTPPTPPAPTRATTKLALQATVACGLALAVGERISETRWPWAVIAAFVVFTRATTAGDTLVRATHRIFGTLVGAIAGVVLAEVVGDHRRAALVTVFAGIFLAFYLLRAAYGLAVFFITADLAVLYRLLGRFSPELLYLRLELTLAGAAIGALVAALLWPARTGSDVRARAAALLRHVADHMDAALGDRPRRPPPELLASARALDAELRDLRAAAHPLTGGLVFPDRAASRLVRVLSALVGRARQLAGGAPSVRDVPRDVADAIASHARAIAAAIAAPSPAPTSSTSSAPRPAARARRAPTHDAPHAWADRVVRLLDEIAGAADVADAARGGTGADVPTLS